MIKSRSEALDLCNKVNKVIMSCDMHNKDQLKIAMRFSIRAAKQLQPYNIDYVVESSFEDLCSALGFSYYQSMLKNYIKNNPRNWP